VRPALAMTPWTGRRLIVSPTSVLQALPFEALVTDRAPAVKNMSDVRFFVEEQSVRYVPSSAVLISMRAREARATAGGTLVVADPLYCLEAGRESARDDALRRLPGTRREARAIAGTLDRDTGLEKRSVTMVDSDLVVSLGEHASRACLLDREDLREFEVLHVAAHGVADTWSTRRTGLVLSNDELVSIDDILGLDIDADVTVLSACETARGRSRGLDGTQSIGLAFLMAGSRSVVSSQWMVDDDAAAALMASFHRQRRALGTADALRAAQLEWLGGQATSTPGTERGAAPKLLAPSTAPRFDYRHPFYWAPFITTGLR